MISRKVFLKVQENCSIVELASNSLICLSSKILILRETSKNSRHKVIKHLVCFVFLQLASNVFSQNLLNVYKIRSSNIPFDSMNMVQDIKNNVKILKSTDNVRDVEDSLDVNEVFIIFDLLNTEKKQLTYKGRKYFITSCKLVSIFPKDTIFNSNSVKRRYFVVLGLKVKRKFSNKFYNINSEDIVVDYNLFSDSMVSFSNNSKKEVKSVQNFLKITFYSNRKCDTVLFTDKLVLLNNPLNSNSDTEIWKSSIRNSIYLISSKRLKSTRTFVNNHYYWEDSD